MIAIKYVGDNRFFGMVLDVIKASALNNPGMTVMEYVETHPTGEHTHVE